MGKSKLMIALGYFLICREDCQDCPLNQPVDGLTKESGEKPTFCDLMKKVATEFPEGDEEVTQARKKKATDQ